MAAKQTSFADWIYKELDRKQWRQSDLVRIAPVDSGLLSRILSGERSAGPDTCTSIARALGHRPEYVFRKAGLLPPEPPEVEEEHQATDLFRRLDRNLRRSIITTMRSLLGLSTIPSYNVTEARTDYHTDPIHDMAAEALTRQLDTMHPDDQKAVLDYMNRLQEKRGGKQEGAARRASEESAI